MTNSHLIPLQNDNKILYLDVNGKDSLHRIKKFSAWLTATGRYWYEPDFRAYRDYLMDVEDLTPESVAVHLSTIRTRYRRLLLQRDLFFSIVPPQKDFVTHKMLADELIARITAAVDPRIAPVRVRKSQDRPDSDFLRLTMNQARSLLASPDTSKLGGRRDKAIIALLLCTGIREAELCALVVEDLEQYIEGQLALHVRKGKGMKERLVPYGSLKWCLPLVKGWMRDACIHSGPIFRGLRKGDNVRKAPLNERTVQKILARYPIEGVGKTLVVKPHDCRRTYARWLYQEGMKIDAIRQNLGHESVQMTFRYIGDPSISDRLPPALPDLTL